MSGTTGIGDRGSEIGGAGASAPARIELPGGMAFQRAKAFGDAYELVAPDGRSLGPQWWHGRQARAFAAAIATPSHPAIVVPDELRQLSEAADSLAEFMAWGDTPEKAAANGAFGKAAICFVRALISKSAAAPEPPFSRVVEDDIYLIWSNEHQAWWRPRSSGYTLKIDKAGRYPRAQALSIAAKAHDGWVEGRAPDEIAVREADALLCAPPLAARDRESGR